MVAAGVAAVGVGAGMVGTRKAAKAAEQANRDAIAEQRSAETRALELSQATIDRGNAAGTALDGMLGLNGQVDNYQNPLLAKLQSQLMERSMNRASATGRNSPADMANIMANSLAEPALQLQQQRSANLMQLYGYGANAAQGAGSNIMGNAQNIGQNMVAAGDAAGMAAASPWMALSQGANAASGFMGMNSVLDAYKSVNGAGGAAKQQGYKQTIQPITNPTIRDPLSVNVTASNFRVPYYGRGTGAPYPLQ